MFPDAWPQWVPWIIGIGAVATALLALTALAVKTGRGVKWAAEWVGGIVRKEVVDIVDARIAPLHMQLMPNGGKSMNDKITRIEAQLTDHIQNSSLDRADLRRWLEHVDPGRHTDPRIAPPAPADPDDGPAY